MVGSFSDFSLVLMAMCDSKYRFTYIDVGTPGRFSDGRTFDQCTLRAAIDAGTLNLPPPTSLPGKMAFKFISNKNCCKSMASTGKIQINDAVILTSL